jgi:hypothetical protein
MCGRVGATRLQVESRNTTKEDTMHPDIASQLAEFRRAELIAEAAHQPLVREARQAQTGISRGHRGPRRWWWVLQPSRALASE